MKLFIGLFFIIILILFLPLRLKSKLIYNLFVNKGIISIYFFSIKLLVSRWKFSSFKILIERENKKNISIPLSNSKKETSDYGEIFVGQLIKKIKFKNLKSIINFGLVENAYFTSIFVGLFKIIIGGLNAFLINKRGLNSINSQIFADFKKSNSLFCICFSLQLNLFTLIYCAISSFFIKFCRGKSLWKLKNQ